MRLWLGTGGFPGSFQGKTEELPSGFVKIAMERSTMFNGKIHVISPGPWLQSWCKKLPEEFSIKSKLEAPKGCFAWFQHADFIWFYVLLQSWADGNTTIVGLIPMILNPAFMKLCSNNGCSKLGTIGNRFRLVLCTYEHWKYSQPKTMFNWKLGSPLQHRR